MTMKAHTYYIIFGRPPIGGEASPLAAPLTEGTGEQNAEERADLSEHLGFVEELDHDISTDDDRLGGHHQQREVAALDAVVDGGSVVFHLLVAHHKQRTCHSHGRSYVQARGGNWLLDI